MVATILVCLLCKPGRKLVPLGSDASECQALFYIGIQVAERRFAGIAGGAAELFFNPQ